MAADKTSKQLTDTINRGGYSTVAEAGGEGRSTVWGYCHPRVPKAQKPEAAPGASGEGRKLHASAPAACLDRKVLGGT